MNDTLFKSSNPCRTNISSSNIKTVFSPLCTQNLKNVNCNLYDSFDDAYDVNKKTLLYHTYG